MYLNNIRPYYLLNKNDYFKHCKNVSIPNNYKENSYTGWTTIIYQIILFEYKN